MRSRLHALRDGGERGFANTGIAVVAAVAVALTATAVVVSMTREEGRPAASSEPAAEQSEPAAEQGAGGPREAEWTGDTMSALKNAATAMEVWGVENGGAYTGACGGPSSTSCAPFDRTAAGGPSNGLVENGLVLPPGVTLEVIRADAAGYCLRAEHASLPGYEAYYASEAGAPGAKPCR